MVGMESYIKERLNTKKLNGEDLVPETRIYLTLAI